MPNLTDTQHEAFAGMVDEKGLTWAVSFADKHLGTDEAAALAAWYFIRTEDPTHAFIVEHLPCWDADRLVEMFGTGRVGAAMSHLRWNVSVPNLTF